MTPRPPRWRCGFSRRRLSDEWRDFVVGDLEEEFETRRAVSPPPPADGLVAGHPLPRGATAPEADPGGPHPSKSRGDSMIRTLAADLRYAVRVLFRAPSFAVAVVPFSRSASARIRRSSASSTRSSCGRCRSTQPDRLVRLFHVPPQATFPGIAALFGVGGELLRLAAAGAVVRGHVDLPLPAVRADRQRQRGVGRRRRRRRGVLLRSCAARRSSGACSCRRRTLPRAGTWRS